MDLDPWLHLSDDVDPPELPIPSTVEASALSRWSCTVWAQRRGEEGKSEMICVSVEVVDGAGTRRVRATAPSIEGALKIAGGGVPGRRVRILFPIDPETFFVPERPNQKVAA